MVIIPPTLQPTTANDLDKAAVILYKMTIQFHLTHEAKHYKNRNGHIFFIQEVHEATYWNTNALTNKRDIVMEPCRR